jgi:hypothetical protein
VLLLRGSTSTLIETITRLLFFYRYEEITSRKLLGKRRRSDIVERGAGDGPSQITDKDGFMKPV